MQNPQIYLINLG